MLSYFFIDRPKFAIVISLVITIAGFIAMKMMPIAEFPDIVPPQVQVTATYPGASAEVVEQSIAAPIEAQVNGVDDMLYMSSTSANDGSYTLTVTFEVGTDPDIASVNVQNRVALATPQLPSDVTKQGVTTQKQSSNMLLIINLFTEDNSKDELYLSNYASIHLQDQLARINGVGKASQFTALDYGMRVWVDPKKLEALGLSTQDISQAISNQNIQASVGQLGAPPYDDARPQFQYTLQAKGRLQDVKEFENIIVRANENGSIVRMKDVARVELGSQYYSGSSYLNNRPTSTIAIYLSPGANAIEVADKVYAELEGLSKRFPPGLEYSILYDTTTSVRASIEEVVVTLFMTFGLVVLVTFLFLGDWRATLIPTIAIPVSLIGVMAAMLGLGFSINMITLFALILAIGVVVDDGIIVVENVKRILTAGEKDVREATRKTMKEVTGPVVATTLVLLAVFVPVTFMPGITGELYRQFAVTISVAVIISSINALTLSPALCRLLLKSDELEPKGILKVFSNGVDKTRNGYVSVVTKLIHRYKLTMMVFLGFVVATGYLFSATPTGFLPTEDRGALMANIQLPDGASLQRTEAYSQKFTDALKEVEGVKDVITINGFSIFSGAASNSALGVIVLDDWADRPDLPWYKIFFKINALLKSFPEADSFAFPLPPISGLGTSGGLEGQILDLSNGSPQELAAVMRNLMFKVNQDPEIKQAFTTFSADVPQYFLDINREKAETFGVEISDIFSMLQTNLGSFYVNDFNLYGKTYKVMIMAEAKDRIDLSDLQDLKVKNKNDQMVPLTSLMDIEPILGPLSIPRYNMYRTASLSVSPETGVSTGEAIGVFDKVAKEALPEGYYVEWTGTTAQELAAGNLVVFIFVLAIVFAYLFLVAQYESWSVPVSVMTSVVIAMFGAMLPLYLLPGLDNNLYTQIGMVLLIGLASKNAILMVEFAKVRREEEKEPIIESAIQAAHLRFRPLVMTALSFLLGALPLLFASGAGAASRFFIGVTVIGGMLAAVVIGVMFIPVLYVFFQTIRETVKQKLFGVNPD